MKYVKHIKNIKDNFSIEIKILNCYVIQMVNKYKCIINNAAQLHDQHFHFCELFIYSLVILFEIIGSFKKSYLTIKN